MRRTEHQAAKVRPAMAAAEFKAALSYLLAGKTAAQRRVHLDHSARDKDKIQPAPTQKTGKKARRGK